MRHVSTDSALNLCLMWPIISATELKHPQQQFQMRKLVGIVTEPSAKPARPGRRRCRALAGPNGCAISLPAQFTERRSGATQLSHVRCQIVAQVLPNTSAIHVGCIYRFPPIRRR